MTAARRSADRNGSATQVGADRITTTSSGTAKATEMTARCQREVGTNIVGDHPFPCEGNPKGAGVESIEIALTDIFALERHLWASLWTSNVQNCPVWPKFASLVYLATIDSAGNLSHRRPRCG